MATLFFCSTFFSYASAQSWWESPLGIYEKFRAEVNYPAPKYHDYVSEQAEFFLRAQAVYDDMSQSGSGLRIEGPRSGVRVMKQVVEGGVVKSARISAHMFASAIDLGNGGNFSPREQIKNDQPTVFFKTLLAADKHGLSLPLVEDYVHFEGRPRTVLDSSVRNPELARTGTWRLTLEENISALNGFFSKTYTHSKTAELIQEFGGRNRRTDLYLISITAERMNGLCDCDRRTLSEERSAERQGAAAGLFRDETKLESLRSQAFNRQLSPASVTSREPLLQADVPFRNQTDHYSTGFALRDLKLTPTEVEINKRIRSSIKLQKELGIGGISSDSLGHYSGEYFHFDRAIRPKPFFLKGRDLK